MWTEPGDHPRISAETPKILKEEGGIRRNKDRNREWERGKEEISRIKIHPSVCCGYLWDVDLWIIPFFLISSTFSK